MNLTRRCASIALAVVATVVVALPTSTAVVAQAAPAPVPATTPVKQNVKIPLIYVASAIETATLAESFATPMRLRGYDVHVFTTKDDNDPANNPFYTIRGNSAKLGRFVTALSRKTGQKRFDVVGASQTGLVIRYWLKYYGGQQMARNVVLLSGIVKGSPYQAQWLRQGKCPPPDRLQYLPPQYRKVNPTPACAEEAMGSKVVNALNTPREALPGIRYTNITTLQEEEAAPYWINLMSGPGDYRNVITQNLCPNDPVVHINMTLLPSMQSLVDSALRGGRLTMDCMVPVVPGVPTLRDTIKPLKSPPGISLPSGYPVPRGY
ncbi:lipase [Gordonia sp. TBRC 11910]|uniref:Lipase n=1 Tax=Gordonia asplenii TaxID=2725283 RepID=A0A848L5X0_9ACTN|nr:lipase [Gordonia asplenii]NMO03941.1 lipase [Gordonia asplenii]